MNFIKKTVVSVFRKFGYTLLKGDHGQESLALAAPELPADLLVNCRVLPSRYKVLPHLPKGGIIAEVGVGWGGFSEELMKVLQPEKFYALDLFNSKPESSLFITGIPAGTDQFGFYTEKFKQEISAGKMEIRSGYSWEALAAFPDHFFDYIYIDADHSYEAVKKDLAESHRKIKPGGLIQLNDYTVYDPAHMQPYGVQKAANEFILEEGYEMIFYALNNLGFDDIVIRKK